MAKVNEFKERERVTAKLLVTSVSKGVNANQASYLSIELRDGTGSISAKKWDSTEEDYELFQAGKVLLVTGDVLLYKENLQLKVIEAVTLSDDDVNYAEFMKQPPLSKEELTNKFNNYVKSVKDDNCVKLLNYFINKFGAPIYDAPAARSIHHEYSSGLLMHSTSMADIADSLVNIYPNINRDLLITGVLLHDFGKLIELEGPVIYKYTMEGELLGHISIMVSLIKEAGDQLKLDDEFVTVISHMILSHHGQKDFGSPVEPMTLEANILYMLDNIDSKITIINKALEDTKKGEFSQKVFALDDRKIYKPKL